MSADTQEQAANLFGRLFHLDERWRQLNPRRALGGIHAAGGFQYQFDVLLNRICDASKTAFANGQIPVGPTVASELLSDVLHSDAGSGCTYVVQVKRLLRADQLASALKEFAAVARFLEREDPDALNGVLFRVVTRKSEVADAASAVNKWLHRTPGLTAAARDAIRRVNVQQEPDPVDEVVGFLINDLGCARPYDELARLRGMLIGRASSPAEGVRDVTQEISALRRNAEPLPTSVYWVRDGDVLPAKVTQGNVLVGSKPRFVDLRAGNLTVRPQYERLVSDFSEFIDDVVAGKESKQPVFWIEGRSGTGKSIALLYLLSQLKQTRPLDVLYLPQFAGLPEAQNLALAGTKAGRTVVLGVDDAFAPGDSGTRAWNEALARTSAFQETGEYGRHPVLVCCGPAEQRRTLGQGFAEQAKVRKWQLPNATREDVEGLRGWYSQRTGKLPPEVGDENILLVQVFFEWRMGQSIADFARRFRNRLKALSPRCLEVVARVLAANRLYIDYPNAGFQDLGLPPDEWDALHVLLTEHHLEPSFAQDGRVRISHPHLADAIYETWYPSDGTATHTRSDHLSRLLASYADEEADPAEQMAPVWGLCHNLRSPLASTVRSRLTGEELDEVLCAKYRDLLDGVGDDTAIVPYLPAWIELSALLPSLSLGPAPFSVALNSLAACTEPCRGLRLVCHKLLEFRGKADRPLEITNAVVSVLKRFPDWHEWPFVAADVVRHHPDDDELASLSTAWLHGQSRATRGMAQLFADLVEARPGDERIIAELSASPCMRSRHESRLVSWACRYSPRTAGPILSTWLVDHGQERWAARTIGAAISAGMAAAVPAGEAWCAQWHTEENATWVLEPLLDCEPRKTQYRDWGLAWLSVNGGPAASYLIERLFASYPGDQDVTEAAYNWLDSEPPDLPHWLPVWLTLSRQRDAGAVALARLGLDGLRAAPTSSRAWVPAWKRLWQVSRSDSAAIELLVEKLSATEALQNNRAWLRAWVTAFRATSADRRVTDLGLKWLNARLTTRRWAMTWTLVADARGEDEAVIDCALRWLAHNTRTWRVWAAIWLRCHKAASTKQQFARLAEASREWLLTVPPEEVPSWPMIWQKAAKELGIGRDLAESGARWLEEEANWPSGDWDKIWCPLWRHDPKPDLRDLGTRWLRDGIHTYGAWPTVWRELWQADRTRELSELAVQWLKNRDHFIHGSWVRILRDVAGADIAGINASDAGLTWLRVTPSSSNWWGTVWMTAVRGLRPLPDALVELGSTWLDRSPPTSNAWGKVAERLAQENRLAPGLPEHLARYLAENHSVNQWGGLWRLLHTLSSTVDTVALGEGWLAATLRRSHGHPTWHMVWQDLVAEAQGERLTELKQMGVEWLRVSRARATPWPNVWLDLWNMEPRPELVELGRNWLDKGFDGNPSYERVARSLEELPAR